MKRLLMLLFVVSFLGFGVFATAETDSGNGMAGEVTLGVTLETFNDTFMRYLLDDLTDEAETSGAKVIASDARSDPNEQIKHVENFITQGVDAIIVHAINDSIAPRISELATAAEIPLVYVNRKPGDAAALQGDHIVVVASPEPVAGRLQAEYIIDQIGENGNVVILMGGMGSSPQIGRTEGAKEVFARYPGITVTKEQTAKWQRPEAIAVVENWLASGETIDAIVANNDEMAIGALLVLEEKGIKDQVIVVGVDATPDAKKFIGESRLDMTVFQDGKAQGRGAVKAALKLIKGEAVEKEVEIPFVGVTLDNYMDSKFQ